MNKNVISLLPHNQKLFDEIMELINNGEHSIFYSEATGLGKSFIFMSLVNELFRNKKVLYIVPKIAIWENMKQYKEFAYIEDFVEMTTYADFNSTKINHYDYDAIFIDECHHLVSDIQGANIVKLCKGYVDAERYIFGFTATPEVKVGKKIINVDTYFNSKVYGLDIEQAIESGLFKKIEYAIADPDTVVDDEEYRKRYSIDGTKTLLENIIAEHSDITRWLVYFSNISVLNKNLPAVKKLFPDFKIFTMHSGNNNSDEQLKEFNSYTGKSMLLTVSMVLEGVHPEKVGGILLYRNVSKRNTLLQVLGRVCSMSNKRSPICVDITNCIYNIPLSYLEDLTDGNSKESGGGRKRRSIRPIIDIKASTYRYIELAEKLYSSYRIKEYGGIRYRNATDLSLQLGFSRGYVYMVLKSGKYNSCEEFIDAYNAGKIYGYEHGGYKYKSARDLSLQLGYDTYYISRLIRSGKYNSCEEFIDAHNAGKIKPKKDKCDYYEYGGYKYKSAHDLSLQLGFCGTYIRKLIRSGKYNSCEEFIDACNAGKIKPKKDKCDYYEYGGYKYKNQYDLSLQLGYNKNYISNLIFRGKYNSCEEFIDACNAGKIKPKKKK